MISQNINILLADDDKDDCLFFKEALEELRVSAHLATVPDGEQLMQLLHKEARAKDFSPLPDVLFLDLNMPRKNGVTCLEEIKHDKKLKHLPVIIFSTSFEERIADLLYKNGAQYYICKPADFSELKKVIQLAVTLIMQSHGKPGRTTQREEFLLSNVKSILVGSRQ